MQDGRDAADFTILCSLDMNDSFGRATGTSVALRKHEGMQATVFYGVVQSSLMNMLLDGSQLFVDKADSALEQFKDSRATACSLGRSVTPCQPLSQLRPCPGFGRGFQHCHPPLAQQSPPSLFVAPAEVSTGTVDNGGSKQPSLTVPPAAAASKPS